MALQNVKPDGNVPFIGPRSRFSLTGFEPRWIFQTMFTSLQFDKKLARTASFLAPDLDPAVVAGKAEFKDLTEGGIFDTIATAKKAHVVEDIINPGSATLDIVRLEDLQSAQTGGDITTAPTFRSVPGSFPFTLSPGETIRANSGTAANPLGIFIREELRAIRA